MTQAKVRESNEEYIAEIRETSRHPINEPPLLVYPTLAAQIGLNNAIFIQQVQFWLSGRRHIRDGKAWIYNTFDQWKEQFPFWSETTIKRIVTELRANGVLLTTDKYNDDNRDRTLWYAIDYEKLDEFVSSGEGVSNGDTQKEGVSIGHWHNVQRTRSYKTENTTHKTTKQGSTRADDTGKEEKEKRSTTFPPSAETTPKKPKKSSVEQPPLGFDDIPLDGKPKEERDPLEHSKMFGILGDILGWDTKIPKMRGRLGKEVKELRAAGYTVEDLDTFRHDLWPNYWAYKKEGRRPRLGEILELLGPLKMGTPNFAPAEDKTVHVGFKLNGKYHIMLKAESTLDDNDVVVPPDQLEYYVANGRLKDGT